MRQFKVPVQAAKCNAQQQGHTINTTSIVVGCRKTFHDSRTATVYGGFSGLKVRELDIVSRTLLVYTGPALRCMHVHPLTVLSTVHNALKSLFHLLAQLQRHVQHGAAAMADVAS